MSLYPYQREGVRFLMDNPRSYLADQMGLGKTVQALVAASRLGLRRALVVCPASARLNWEREARAWAPAVEVQTVSYTLLRMRIREYLAYPRAHWDVVILDEAHYVKNTKAERSKAVLRIAQRTPRAWCLSGSPMPNHYPSEIYPAFRILRPDILARTGLRTASWERTFTKMYETARGWVPYRIRNVELFRALLRELPMLRRSEKEVELDLPPLRVDTHLIPNDDRFERALEELGHDWEHWDAPAMATARRLLGEYKAPYIAKTIAEELKNGSYEKVVVLAYHRSVLSVLREAFRPFGVTGFDGSTPQARRQEAIDLFTTGAPRAFVAQQTAAGVAINLQAASEVVLVEPSWVPEENAQAVKRIHRVGQTRPCRARLFAVDDTLDEAIMGTLARKMQMNHDIGL